MSLPEKKVKAEYAKRLKAFRKQANFSQIALAQAIGLFQPEIAAIESGKRSIGLDKIEQIANFFGVKYYHFADPDFPLPSKQELRESVVKYIEAHHIEAGYILNEKAKVSYCIDKLLETDFLSTFKTSAEIAAECKLKYDIVIEPFRVTDILTRSGRLEKIEVIKPLKGKRNLYKLKESHSTP